MGASVIARRLFGTGAAMACIALVAPSGAMAGDGPDGPGYLQEVGSALLPLRGGNDDAIADARLNEVRVSRADRTVVDVYVSGPIDEAVAKLRAAGMSVGATATDPVHVVEGWIPVTDLGQAAKLGVSDAVVPAEAGGTDAGAVLCECVGAHNIPQATAAGAGNGSGVDVGVISDSINQVLTGVAGSQGTGDLPAATVVLKDGLPGDSDEGRAMSEIVYDEAPGLNKLMFASGTNLGA